MGPYNPLLLLRYNCHINVEKCASILGAKYIYKYTTKGPIKPGSCFTGSHTPHVLVVLYLVPWCSVLNLNADHGSVGALCCVLVNVLCPQDRCTLLHIYVAFVSEEEQRVVGNNHTVVSCVGYSLSLYLDGATTITGIKFIIYIWIES